MKSPKEERVLLRAHLISCLSEKRDHAHLLKAHVEKMHVGAWHIAYEIEYGTVNNASFSSLQSFNIQMNKIASNNMTLGLYRKIERNPKYEVYY